MFLIPLCAFLVYIFVYYHRRKNMVESVVAAWLFLTGYTWLITEVLSAFNLLNVLTVAIFWGGACIGLLFYFVRLQIWTEIKKFVEDLRNKRYKIDSNLVCAIIFCTLITVLAVFRSQNLVDNLFHRLSKIMHWIQNGNVDQFATGTLMELHYAQLVEYMNMHIYLLSGSDRLMGIIQAGAYICSGCCVYGIGRKLNASSKFAWVGVWIFFLIPIVVIETVTTQTDIVAGVYLLSFVYFLMDFIGADKLTIDKQGVMSVVYMSASVIFGYLAKPTVCFAMVVFFVWMCVVRVLKRDKLSVLLPYALIGSVVALILFMPSSVRRYRYNHIPDVIISDGDLELDNEKDLSMNDGSMVLERISSPRAFTVIAAQNIAANSTTRCFPKINNILTRMVEKCEKLMDYIPERQFRVVVTLGSSLGETSEPSPVIMWFLFGAWLAVIIRVSRIDRTQFIYLLCATTGMILQAGLMEYSLFRQRYFIGVMAVLCPAFSVVLEQIRFSAETKTKMITAAVVISCFGTTNALMYEVPYTVFGLRGDKIYGYFLGDETELYYRELFSYINDNNYHTVGMSGTIPYEYVLWQGIDKLDRMEHVNVALEGYDSAKLEDEEFLPDCIVIAQSKEYIELGEQMECHGMTYVCDWRARDDEREDNYAVMIRYDLE